VAAAVVFGVVVWYDAGFLAPAQHEAQASFSVSSVVWLMALGTLLVAGAVILFAGLAWWAESLLASIAFLLAGLLETLLYPLVFGNYGLPDAVQYNAVGWLQWTSGPLSTASILGAALAVAGLVGIYRWLITRQAAAT
jgi:hypothetical protein